VKVYIAARYSRKVEVSTIAAALTAHGYTVTSTWHDEPHSADAQLADLTADDLRMYANRDLLEIRMCYVLLFLSESDQSYNRRGGRHVEFGYALGQGKFIAVIGPLENIFHHLVGVYRHVDLDSFIKEWNDGPDWAYIGHGPMRK